MAGLKIQKSLITGASSGIGAAFASHLAAAGSDLILVARRQERLEELANQLEAQYSVHVEALPADLTEPEDLARVEEAIRSSGPLDLLVNNAGFGTSGEFWKVDIASQEDMILLHILASVRLAYAALPEMVRRRNGGIIMVSSMAAFFPLRGAINYSATKAYLNSFSQGLAHELHGKGVRVQALCPGFTHTEFHDSPEYERRDPRSKIPGVLWTDANEVVRTSLKAIRRGRQVIVISGAQYRAIDRLRRTGIIHIGLSVWDDMRFLWSGSEEAE